MFSSSRLAVMLQSAVAAMLISCVVSPEPAVAAPEPAARRLVERTLSGLSAGRDMATLNSISAEGHETVYDLVENDHPMTPPFYLPSINKIRREDDLLNGLQRTTIDNPGVTVTALLGDDVMVTTRPGGAASARRVRSAPPCWAMRNPVAALRLAARASDLRLEPDIIWHGAAQHVLGFHRGPYLARIYVGVGTGLPTATEAVVTYDEQHLDESIAWNALGDVSERTEFMNWSVEDGVRYPLQHDTFRDGQLLRTTTISKIVLNAPVDTSELKLAPGEAFSRASVQDYRPDQKVPGPYPGKPISEIVPGVVQIPNSWYSTIVRQRDGLVIIDAPISAGYAKGILAEAARRYPGIPVKALITSTGFFWHVAGVREFAAHNIPIYAEARNVPVIERMLNARHSLAPDDLSSHPHARPVVIPVSRRTVIGTGVNAIEIFPVTEATQPMLMTYIRDAKLLHTGEMVQPLGPQGSILFPESVIELLHSVAADGLQVETMIGMHMSPTPWSALAKTLEAAHAKS